MQTAEAVVRLVWLGVGGTVFMDASAWLQKRLWGMASADYGLVGRWLGHMCHGQFCHESIVKAPRRRHERLVGWLFHYITGCVFAGVLVAVEGLGWLQQPTLLPALLTGLMSVVAPFFVLQPAFGFGLAASKTPNPWAARRRSLMAHLLFGVGLFLAGWVGALG